MIHPHLPVGIPCYDFTPIIYPTLGSSLLAVRPLTSGVVNSRGVTGGVYKARERIHRDMLIPVSYTHLDVYKRQLLYLPQLSIRLTPLPFDSRICLAVGYLACTCISISRIR